MWKEGQTDVCVDGCLPCSGAPQACCQKAKTRDLGTLLQRELSGRESGPWLEPQCLPRGPDRPSALLRISALGSPVPGPNPAHGPAPLAYLQAKQREWVPDAGSWSLPLTVPAWGCFPTRPWASRGGAGMRSSPGHPGRSAESRAVHLVGIAVCFLNGPSVGAALGAHLGSGTQCHPPGSDLAAASLGS